MPDLVTHDGRFHADDAFAVATLRAIHGDGLTVVRTRDRARHAAADLRVDVGLRSDPATGDFDHHQRGGAGARANGIRFASFGLVWAAFGVERCDGSPEVAAAVDAALVQPVDAEDNGQDLWTALEYADARPYSISRAIAALNPTWDEEQDFDGRFEMAVRLAGDVLAAEVSRAAGKVRATGEVMAAIAAAEDPRVIVLERFAPWQDAVLEHAPAALYVVYPNPAGRFAVHTVPVEPDSFEDRRPLPETWAGLSDDELATATGVDDATFCHVNRFIAVAGSRAGALELARRAL